MVWSAVEPLSHRDRTWVNLRCDKWLTLYLQDVKGYGLIELCGVLWLNYTTLAATEYEWIDSVVWLAVNFIHAAYNMIWAYRTLRCGWLLTLYQTGCSRIRADITVFCGQWLILHQIGCSRIWLDRTLWCNQCLTL